MNKVNGAVSGMLFNNAVLLAIRNTKNDMAVNKDVIMGCAKIVCDTFDSFEEMINDRYSEPILQTEHKPKIDFKVNKLSL